MAAQFRRHKMGRALVLLAFVAMSVVGCESQDFTPDATMQTMPESRLVPFPGATLLVQGASPRRQSLEGGTAAAYLIRKFGTDATEAQVIAYYASLLGPLGWKHPCEKCDFWEKPGYQFQITSEPPGSLPSSQQGYGLVYNELLLEVLSPPTRAATTRPS